MQLDKIDINILSELQKDSRLTKSQISEKVNLSESACWQRIKKLEKAGVILGYDVHLDMNKISSFRIMFVHITIKDYPNFSFDEFEEYMWSLPFVMEVHSITGRLDFVIKVVVSSLPYFQRKMRELIQMKNSPISGWSFEMVYESKFRKQQVSVKDIVAMKDTE